MTGLEYVKKLVFRVALFASWQQIQPTDLIKTRVMPWECWLCKNWGQESPQASKWQDDGGWKVPSCGAGTGRLRVGDLQALVDRGVADRTIVAKPAIRCNTSQQHIRAPHLKYLLLKGDKSPQMGVPNAWCPMHNAHDLGTSSLWPVGTSLTAGSANHSS